MGALDMQKNLPIDQNMRGRQRMVDIFDRLSSPLYTYIFKEGTATSSMRLKRFSETDYPANCSRLEMVSRWLLGSTAQVSTEDITNPSISQSFATLSTALRSITDPTHRDFSPFNYGTQPLVEAAFISVALLRCPPDVWNLLDFTTRNNVTAALNDARSIRPHFNNWLLFSAAVEAFFCKIGADWDPMRVDYALRQHEQWYLGDGVYSDGPSFHFDYYNSFVILPLLLEILWAVKGSHRDWDRMYEAVLARAQRHAVHLERLIGPDGTFPPVGRSLSYRCGAFHLLALLAWKGLLPAQLKPAQVREALIAVIERTLGSQQNFDNDGFLRVGLSGSQPDLAEGYISTGSLYLCSTAFLPLALPPEDAFWRDPEESWTQRRLWWFNDQIPRDQALKA